MLSDQNIGAINVTVNGSGNDHGIFQEQFQEHHTVQCVEPFQLVPKGRITVSPHREVGQPEVQY